MCTIVEKRIDSRNRNSEFNEREIYTWERVNNVNKLPFKAPVKEDITEIKYETYDIEYVYSGEITTESELYTYQKDITRELKTWEPKTVWYDFSNAESSEQSSISLNQISV